MTPTILDYYGIVDLNSKSRYHLPRDFAQNQSNLIEEIKGYTQDELQSVFSGLSKHANNSDIFQFINNEIALNVTKNTTEGRFEHNYTLILKKDAASDRILQYSNDNSIAGLSETYRDNSKIMFKETKDFVFLNVLNSVNSNCISDLTEAYNFVNDIKNTYFIA